jgi:hypothetical protein
MEIEFILSTLKPLINKIIKKVEVFQINIKVEFKDGKIMQIGKEEINKLIKEEKLEKIIEVKNDNG